MWHICLQLSIHPCMSCSLSGSILIQEAGFGLSCSLATSMGGPYCSFSAVLFVQFRGLCFSGMSLHANQSWRTAACFLSHSYTSAGFRGGTGQKAEKQEGRKEEKHERSAFKLELPLFACRCAVCES